MRLEESPDLFGRGSGDSTCGELTCAICRTTYNKDADLTEDYSGDSVGYTYFAGRKVCENCFGEIESEILGRMQDILPWYRRHVERSKKRICVADENLKALGA
jgi:hypothetical protein